MDRNIFRLKSWTHYSAKPPKGQGAGVVISLGCKAELGRHVVVLVIGDLAEDEPLTHRKLDAMLRALGPLPASPLDDEETARDESRS